MKVMTFLYILILLHTLGNSAKVAIIGRGLGAALCSYYLRQMIPKIEIEIYDHKPNVKNVLRAIVHSKYFYMNELIQSKGFSSKPITKDERPMVKQGDQMDLFDVKELTKNDPTGYLKVQEFIQEKLKKFEKIYEFLSKGQSFKTVQELLKSLAPEFEDYYTNKTTSWFLKENIPDSVNPGITKFVNAELSGGCLADLNAHAFVGLEMLMFSELTGDISIITAGEQEVLKKLYKKRQHFIEKDILKIIHSNVDNMNYVVMDDNRQSAYDFVILSTLTAPQIKFKGFTKQVNIFEYVIGRITYIKGDLLEPFKEFPTKTNTIVNLDKNHTFTKIRQNTFKIAKKSTDALESEIIEYVNPYVIDSFGGFIACPDYWKNKLVRKAKFELGENLYNVQALDCLAVTNEMYAISAKNIALLINQKISKNTTLPETSEVGTTSTGPNTNQKGPKNKQGGKKKNLHKKNNKKKI